MKISHVQNLHIWVLTKIKPIDAYFIFYKRHYWHKIIVYKRQNIQKEFCRRVIITISLYFNLTMHTPSTGW